MKAIRNFDINIGEFADLVPFIAEARDHEAAKIKNNPLLDEGPLEWTDDQWIRMITMSVRCFDKKWMIKKWPPIRIAWRTHTGRVLSTQDARQEVKYEQ